jgi:periplasmic divalent cation tolerance protein
MTAIVVFMTAPNRDEAEKLARLLLEQRHAACVQILPEILSFYHWQDEILQDKEILLLAKTTDTRFAALEKAIRENHSYEVPEIVAVPASQISPPYLQWLTENTKSTDK